MISQAALAIKHNQLVARIEKADKDSRAASREASPIFQLILSSSLPESEKRRDRIAQEGATVFVAGAETTARVLTTATYHLLANEDVLIRLQEELRKATPDPSMDFDLKKAERLPWLVRYLSTSNGNLLTETDCNHQGGFANWGLDYFTITSYLSQPAFTIR